MESQVEFNASVSVFQTYFEETETKFATLDSRGTEELKKNISQAEPLFRNEVKQLNCNSSCWKTLLSILAQKNYIESRLDDKIEIIQLLQKAREKFPDELDDLKLLHQIVLTVQMQDDASLIQSISRLEIGSPQPFLETKDLFDARSQKSMKAISKIFSKGLDSVEEKTKVFKKLEKTIKKYKSSSEKAQISHLYLKGVQTLLHACSQIELSCYNLCLQTVFHIACFVEGEFARNVFRKKNIPLREVDQLVHIKKDKKSGPPLSLLINLTKKCFTILCGSHSGRETKPRKIKPTLSFLRDEDGSVSFYPTEQEITKDGMMISEKEMGFLREFQGRRGLASSIIYMEYEKEKSSKVYTKQTFIRDRTEGTLKELVQGLEEKTSIQWEILYTIIEDVAHGIEYMHKKNYAHWNIKLENVYYYTVRDNKQRQLYYFGMLSDFSLTFDASASQPHWLFPRYGCESVLAPEASLACISQEQAKQRDMFALGCMLFQIIEEKSPISKAIWRQVRDKKCTEQELDRLIQVFKNARFCLGPKSPLRLMAYHLIHPNRTKRWDIATFVREIQSARNELFAPTPRLQEDLSLLSSRISSTKNE